LYLASGGEYAQTRILSCSLNDLEKEVKMKMNHKCWGTDKKCASCAFWVGNREVDISGLFVNLPSAMDQGKCVIPKGPFRGIQTNVNQHCNSWQKWPALR